MNNGAGSRAEDSRSFSRAEPQMRTQTPTPIPTSNRPKAAASTIWASSVALGTGKQVPAVQDQGQTCEQVRR
ncbi:unnamed protein product [Arctogadus glacialis]